MAREEKFITTVELNAQQAQDKIRELSNQIKILSKKKDEAFAAGDVKLGDKYKRELTEAQKAMSRLKIETMSVKDILKNLSNASISQMNRAVRKLNSDMKNLGSSTEEFKEKTEQLKRVKERLAELRVEGKAHESILSRSFNFLNKNWGAFSQILGAVSGLSMTIRKATQDYVNMEEAMMNVRKYTGLADEQVRELNETFKEMDTRTPREKLSALAGDAGRLGIQGKEAIQEFVDAADKIEVALGDDLGENAVRDIGKLSQTFGDSDRMGLRGAMLATGSAVNELSQSSSASAGYIVDFTAKIAGAANIFHCSLSAHHEDVSGAREICEISWSGREEVLGTPEDRCQ